MILDRIINGILASRSGNLPELKRMRVRDLGRKVEGGPGKRVLFNSQFFWPYGNVEYSLATALKLRGHDSMMIACGGLPEYCELETNSAGRPACHACLGSLKPRFDAFGLSYLAQKDYMTKAALEEAAELSSGSVDGLLKAEAGGVPVGRLAYINLFQYFKGYPFEIEGEKEKVFRRCLHSAVLITRAAERIFDEYRPDIAVTVNGKFLQWAPFVCMAERRGIPYVTWEDLDIMPTVRPSGVIFDAGRIAHEQRLDEVWDGIKARPLTEEERRTLLEHYNLWANGKISSFQYYDETAVRNASEIKKRLGLRPGAPVVALFPNVIWDSTSVGFDGAFDGMFDWMFKAVAYAERRPEMEFIIRAHPAEKKLPEQFRSTTPVCDEIRRRCRVPENVRLIDATEPLSSYAIASFSDVVMTYTSTLGIEFALGGRRPWVAGSAYYSGKGFTTDIKSAEQMYSLLDGRKFEHALTRDEIDLAERFAYAVRFRRIFSYPYLRSGVFSPPDFNVLRPGGDAVIDAVCDALTNGRPFMDIGRGL